MATKLVYFSQLLILLLLDCFQGDRERKIEGMDVSPMMDRYNASVEKSQVCVHEDFFHLCFEMF